MGIEAKKFSRYVRKIVKETMQDMIKDEIVRLVAKGTFSEIISESMKTTLQELNVGTAFTTGEGSYGLDGMVDLVSEPEEDEAPEVVDEEAELREFFTNAIQPKKSPMSESQAALNRTVHVPGFDDDGKGGKKKQQQSKPSPSRKELAEAAQKPEANIPSKLQGGNATAGELPDGEVNPAHLLKHLSEKQQALSFPGIPSGTPRNQAEAMDGFAMSEDQILGLANAQR